MSKVWTKSDLIEVCIYLSQREQHDEEAGYHWTTLWGVEVPDELRACSCCTNSARLIAQRCDGMVYGYDIGPGESVALVGCGSRGHDFAVVGDFVVDWWAGVYEEPRRQSVITIAEAIAGRTYKPRSQWICVRR